MINITNDCLETGTGIVLFQDSQLTLTALLNNLPGMVYRCRNDPKWTMEFVSEGCFDLTGYAPGDLILNRLIPYGDLIHPDDRLQVWESVQTALRQRKSFELTYRLITRTGKEKWVRAQGCGAFNGNENTGVLEGFIADITDRMLAEQKIQRQIQRFQVLREIDMAISASFDLRLTLGILLEQIITQLNADAADILLYKPEMGILEYGASRGLRANAIYPQLRLGEGYAGKAALSRNIIYIADLTASPGQLRPSPHFIDEAFRGYYGVPLTAKGQLQGVLEVFQRTRQAVDNEWREFLEALAEQAAIAIDNATLFAGLQRSNTELTIAYDATLEGWAKALELHDRETVGHSHRVIEMTLRLAEAIGVDGGGNLKHIRRGALLHDIGKMGVPDAILLKPGPLTSDEWEIMRQHPIFAYEMLKPIDYLRPALDIPYCHHEKWNGTGYPQGLKGEEIPMAARIFAVVDVWDALTSDRPYRSAWSYDTTRIYIQSEVGKYFDPQIMDAFWKLSCPTHRMG